MEMFLFVLFHILNILSKYAIPIINYSSLFFDKTLPEFLMTLAESYPYA